MPVDAVTQLVDQLRQHRLLTAVQLDEIVRDLQRRFPDSKALATALIERGWLTVYQARLLLAGRGAQLLLGSYVVLDKLGEGGAGQVFKARHQAMQRIVALKVLRPEVLADKEVVARFYREIEVLSQISHPNIVHAYDAGPVGSMLVLAMEYVEGTDLEKLVKQQGRLPVEHAVDYIRQAALGLQHAHEKGLIHRDIKPSNLLVKKPSATSSSSSSDCLMGPWGLVKILDLGLARLTQPAAASPTRNLTRLAGNTTMQGTPDYMSPEQAIDFGSADIRSDIYSLGCTFYCLLTGQPPFGSATLTEKLLKHQSVEPKPVQEVRPEVPANVAQVLHRMLAKRPPDRYQAPNEVAAALPSLEAAFTTARRPSRLRTTPATPPSPPTAPLPAPLPATPARRTQVENWSERSPLWRRLLGWLSFGLIGLTVLLVAGMMLFGGSTPDEQGGTGAAPATKPAFDPRGVLKDSSFETPSVGVGFHDAFRHKPTGTAWTYTGTAGVAGNASGYTAANPPAPQGTQVAFLQYNGGMSQTVVLPAGEYCLEFLAAQRKNTQASSQTFRVLIDGKPVGEFTPLGNTYTAQVTGNFTLSAGSHVITFEALNPRGGDNTAFVDQVQLAPAQAAPRYVKQATRNDTVLATLEANGLPSLRGKWYAIGYFDNANGVHFNTAHPPEKEVDLKKSYPGRGGAPVGWKEFSAMTVGANINLATQAHNDNVTLYLWHEFELREPASLVVGFGSDDHLTVWLNRQQVVHHHGGRGVAADQNVATLHFKAGKNQLLIKVGNGGGSYGVYVMPRWPPRLEAAFGEQLRKDFP
ncbi:MAG: protein kinase [Planctomycetia bacterium]|nr:protein kinase [Planctomycetia bacterium]